MKKLGEIKLKDFYEMDEMKNIIGGSGSGSGSGGSGSGTYPCPSGETYFTGKCVNGLEFAVCATNRDAAISSSDAWCKSQNP